MLKTRRLCGIKAETRERQHLLAIEYIFIQPEPEVDKFKF